MTGDGRHQNNSNYEVSDDSEGDDCGFRNETTPVPSDRESPVGDDDEIIDADQEMEPVHQNGLGGHKRPYQPDEATVAVQSGGDGPAKKSRFQVIRNPLLVASAVGNTSTAGHPNVDQLPTSPATPKVAATQPAQQTGEQTQGEQSDEQSADEAGIEQAKTKVTPSN